MKLERMEKVGTVDFLFTEDVVYPEGCCIVLKRDLREMFARLRICYHFMEYIPFKGAVIRFKKTDALTVKVAFDVIEYEGTK